MDVDTHRPRRIEELWFDDGSIVIQAGDAQYRVYRGALAAHSSVFKDMLSFPQPSDAELVDGCPLVRLPDEEAVVTPSLKALFDPEFFRPFPNHTTFGTIVSCLRLSHKYGVEYLQRRALVHLSSGYAMSVDDLDSLTVLANHADDLDLSTAGRSWKFPEEKLYIVHAIQVAREVDCPWILPHAFYNLASYFQDLGPGAIMQTISYQGSNASLSPQDQQRFFAGLVLQTSQLVEMLSFLTHHAETDGCATPYGCLEERLAILASSQDLLRHNANAPLDIWATTDWDLLSYDSCSLCIVLLKQRYREA